MVSIGSSTKIIMNLTSDRLARDIASLQAEIRALRVEVQELREKQHDLLAQANRWKGAFAVLIGMGGVVVFATNLVLHFLKK